MRHLQPRDHAAVRGAMVAVVEHRDIPAPTQLVEKVEQRARALRELEAQHHFIDDMGRMPADHVADVQLGQLIVGQVQHREALFGQAGDQRAARVVFRVGLHADENVRFTAGVVAIVEFGDLALADGFAERLEAARATRYRNRLEGRSGTLWESRYKSSVVQSDSYLLACSRYIELNPVRARMVANVADYAWSSYRSRVDDESGGGWLDADPCFMALGDTSMERRLRYEEFVRQAIPIDQLRLIRDALQRGQLTGTSRFVDEVERIVGVRVEQRGQGRPRTEPGK